MSEATKGRDKAYTSGRRLYTNDGINGIFDWLCCTIQRNNPFDQTVEIALRSGHGCCLWGVNDVDDLLLRTEPEFMSAATPPGKYDSTSPGKLFVL